MAWSGLVWDRARRRRLTRSERSVDLEVSVGRTHPSPSGSSGEGVHTPPITAIPGIPEIILVAPDSFKGTLTALEVAQAIERGLGRHGRPVDLCPVADGGEGTLDALLAALGGERLTATVHDPLDRTVNAQFGLLSGDKRGKTAIVETAAASGLHLVVPRERDPMRASTRGTGELIGAAIDSGARSGDSVTPSSSCYAMCARRSRMPLACSGPRKGPTLLTCAASRGGFTSSREAGSAIREGCR